MRFVSILMLFAQAALTSSAAEPAVSARRDINGDLLPKGAVACPGC